MKDHFPLPYRLWIITSSVVFVLAMAAQIFFSRTAYGFIYNGALLWLCMASFISLAVGLALWLCRCVLDRKSLKALTRAACALLCVLAAALWFATMVISANAGRTATGAGSISGNSYSVYAAPEGRRRVLVLQAGSGGETFVYPMLGRLLYRELPRGYIPGGLSEGYTVVWTSPQRAVVDGRVVVDFDRLRAASRR